MKTIGITSGFDFDANYYFKGYPRMMLNEDYSRSVIASGAIPFIIPVHDNYDVVYQQVSRVDGILLSGGQDVHPRLYQQQPNQKLGAVSRDRDTFEYLVIKAALALNKPIFGICRGSQVLNVYFGGTLFQDNGIKGEVFQHVQDGNPTLTMHTVIIEEDSFVFNALNKKELEVNSFHHQSIDQIAPTMKVVARALDGIVEAIQHKELPIFAVQWHPEMLSRDNEEARKLFEYFINSVKGCSHE